LGRTEGSRQSKASLVFAAFCFLPSAFCFFNPKSAFRNVRMTLWLADVLTSAVKETARKKIDAGEETTGAGVMKSIRVQVKSLHLVNQFALIQ